MAQWSPSTLNRFVCLTVAKFFPLISFSFIDNNAASANKKTEEAKRVNDTNGGAKGTGKKKRNRSHFTQIQLKYLDDVFSRQQYLTRDERALLAGALDMTELQIRNWFQNRRYQLRHRGINRARQVPVKVLVSSSSAHSTEDWWHVMFIRSARDVDVNFILKENMKLIIMKPAKCQLHTYIYHFLCWRRCSYNILPALKWDWSIISYHK